MAVLMGKDGDLRLVASGGSVTAMAFLDSWSLNLTHDITEVTAFAAGTTESKSYEYTLKGATGSASGTADGACTQQTLILDYLTGTDAGNVDMELRRTTALKISFSAAITGFTIDSAVGDKLAFSFDYTARGTVTNTD